VNICVTSDHCTWKDVAKKKRPLDRIMLVMESAEWGGVCFNGCVAMNDCTDNVARLLPQENVI
jgi:hypothetical protein